MSQKKSNKFVYAFEEGNRNMKEILGGRGANLAEMKNLGINVPPGFTISTQACKIYNDLGKKITPEMETQIKTNLTNLEKKMGKKLGDAKNPLLVSVRSGAVASMPGMMDTILNLGLNDESVKGLAEKTGNERFAWDSYRRLIQMLGNVGLEVDHDEFEHILESVKENKKAKLDTDLSAEDLKEVVTKYKAMIKKVTKKDFPQDPKIQLDLSIRAVFNSWNNYRAIRYREINNIKGLIGTAVNVQAMVFRSEEHTSE